MWIKRCSAADLVWLQLEMTAVTSIGFLYSTWGLSCGHCYVQRRFVCGKQSSLPYCRYWCSSSKIFASRRINCKIVSTQDSEKELVDEKQSFVTAKSDHKQQPGSHVPFLQGKREKDDLKRVGIFVSLSLVLAIVLQFVLGTQTAVEYLTAYIIEESLSVDNLFVFLLIFQYFAVPRDSQDRILFWGILGAVVMRGGMIWSGSELLHHFRFMALVFGGFLLYSSFQFLFSREETPLNIKDNKIYRIATRWIPLSYQEDVDPNAFFVRRRNQKGQLVWFGTPLLLVLLIIELSDVVFALDSIPAVLSVSNDRLVVYVSNLMAILGLRSLFFVLNDFIDKMRFLKQSLSLILGFIGCKMCAQYLGSDWNSIWSLGIVSSILSTGVFLSWRFPTSDKLDDDDSSSVH